MEFSTGMKSELKKKFTDAEIIISDDEVKAALESAYLQFNTVNRSGPPDGAMLQVTTALAVEVLRPTMEELLGVNSEETAPQ